MSIKQIRNLKERCELAETQLISGILDNPDRYYEIKAYGIETGHFSNHINRVIFEKADKVIASLESKDSFLPEIATTITSKIPNAFQEIAKVMETYPSMQWKQYADILIMRGVLMNVEKGYKQFKEDVKDAEEKDDFDNCLFSFQQAISSSSQINASKMLNTDECIEVLQKDINERIKKSNEGLVNAFYTGYKELDDLIGGLEPTHFNILAGRPATGKTSLMLSMLLKIVSRPYPTPCMIFSLEMDALSLTYRLASILSGVWSKNMKNGRLTSWEADKLKSAMGKLSKYPLFIYDKSNCTVDKIREQIMIFKKKHNIGIVAIDYLQLIKARDNKIPREQQVAEISKEMKVIAKENNVSMLVLAQLNRGYEKEEREPRASDLRESGSLEQDADKIMILSPITEQGKEMKSDNSYVDAHIVKNRDGSTGIAHLYFNRYLTRYENQPNNDTTKQYEQERIF